MRRTIYNMPISFQKILKPNSIMWMLFASTITFLVVIVIANTSWKGGEEKTNPCIHINRLEHDAHEKNDYKYIQGIPWVFAITPTYTRPTQKAELTRLCNTFMNVPNFHWIIVEDRDNKTKLVENFLKRCKVKYTHLNQGTPSQWKKKEKEPNWKKPRGVFPRNAALDWLRTNLKGDGRNNQGVVYFADDDNVYDLQIFEEMRYTKKVSVWPVGLVGGLLVETPLLDANHHVIGFNAIWEPSRPFPIDMAGFAVNIDLILRNKSPRFRADAKRGYQESEILQSIVNVNDLEPKADHCTKVYVWHTRTENPKFLPKKDSAKGPKMEV